MESRQVNDVSPQSVRRQRRISIALGIAVVVTGAAAFAGESQFTVHGAAGWSWRTTDETNYYMGATPDGSAANYSAVIVGSYHPFPGLSLHAQAFADNDPVVDESRAAMDFLFLEWRLNDAFRLRGGLVKQPLGLHNETARIGATHPHIELPISYYGESGFVFEGCVGLGITGRTVMANDWELSYDVYTGSMEAPFKIGFTRTSQFMALGLPDIPAVYQPVIAANFVQDTAELQGTVTMDDVAGGRLDISDADSLRFGFSVVSGIADIEYDATRTVLAYGTHLRSDRDRHVFSAEFLHVDLDGDKILIDSGYAEYQFRFGAGHATYLLYEHQHITHSDTVESTKEHRSIGIGLAYQVDPMVVLKVGYQKVYGNRFALPETLSETIADGLDEQTDFLAIGLDVSF